MTSDGWIVIPNWDKFQHYGNRRDAPWIKVYGELNSRDEWRRLPYSERGLLVTIWIEYQRSGGQLNVSDMGSRGGQRVRLRSLEALNHAGFIRIVASKPLALRALAREEKKERREEKGSRPVENRRPAAGAYQQHDHPHDLTPLPAEEALELARQLAQSTA